MSDPSRRVYSPRRFRVVVLLLTLVFLPIVIGASLLIFQYIRFSVMVEQRLRGEKGSVPSRVYARPLVLRPGLVLDAALLANALNGLRYSERADAGRRPASSRAPRAGSSSSRGRSPDGATEPVRSSFATDKTGVTRVKEIRGRGPEAALRACWRSSPS